MGAGHLDPAAFETLLDRNPELLEIELSNYGEMFLNPRLREILRIACDCGVVLHADNGVNLNLAAEETIEALVQYRFRSMTVSIDGASPETYAQYRLRGDFDRVIGHIRKINEYKRRLGSGFPVLCWQFIVFGHNDHEIETAKKMARELGMSFRPKISWDDDFSPVRNLELVRIQTGLPATREEYYRSTGKSYLRSICYQLWNAPVLNWDGRVMGCCRNFWGDFGSNAFTDGLAASLDSPKLRHAREMLMGRADPQSGIPCTTCDLYLAMQRDRSWIGAKEVAQGTATQVVTSVAVGKGGSEATHADVFIAPGREVNRLLLASPPQARRIVLGVDPSALFTLAPDADYVIYVLPKRLDPTYRTHYPPMAPVTVPVSVRQRPIAQEFRIALDAG